MIEKSLNTKVCVFIDGFGGLSVTNINNTAEDVIQYLNDESPWEIFDEMSKLPRGEYEVSLDFWWEDNFPEPGSEFCTNIISMQLRESFSDIKIKNDEEHKKALTQLQNLIVETSKYEKAKFKGTWIEEKPDINSAKAFRIEQTNYQFMLDLPSCYFENYIEEYPTDNQEIGSSFIRSFCEFVAQAIKVDATLEVEKRFND